MFPITTDTQDYGDEDDGPIMSYDDTQIPVDHEVKFRISLSKKRNDLAEENQGYFDDMSVLILINIPL